MSKISEQATQAGRTSWWWDAHVRIAIRAYTRHRDIGQLVARLDHLIYLAEHSNIGPGGPMPDEDRPCHYVTAGRGGDFAVVKTFACPHSEREIVAERGRRLASEREDLIARGADPAELTVPIHPDDEGR